MRIRIAIVALLAGYVGALEPCFASQDFTAKSAAAVIITSVGATRAEISRKIELQKSVTNAGVGLALPSVPSREKVYGLESGHITSNGTLVGYNSKYGVVVILEPTYTAGEVQWRCKVLPLAAASRECQ